MARPIVHASDFSSASAPAFQKALMLAKGMRRPLLVVHDMWYVPHQLEDELHCRIERVARRSLERLLRHARGAGVRVAGLLRDGIVPEQIVTVARAQHAEMIVMGTHGRSGITRVLVGSVASRVVSRASYPVMTVRAA